MLEDSNSNIIHHYIDIAINKLQQRLEGVPIDSKGHILSLGDI